MKNIYKFTHFHYVCVHYKVSVMNVVMQCIVLFLTGTCSYI